MEIFREYNHLNGNHGVVLDACKTTTTTNLARGLLMLEVSCIGKTFTAKPKYSKFSLAMAITWLSLLYVKYKKRDAVIVKQKYDEQLSCQEWKVTLNHHVVTCLENLNEGYGME